jgi:cysteinyl-tRNA synthetase
MFDTFNQVFSIMDFKSLEVEEIPEDILLRLESRNKAKIDKDFGLSDKLRDEILELGYKIIDSREGSRLEKI